jgi:tRNA(Ile)-lysidine synthase TilS/MesJ
LLEMLNYQKNEIQQYKVRNKIRNYITKETTY